MSSIQMTANNDTSIRVSKKLRDKLEHMCKKNQSYENLIWKLINKKK